MQQQSTRRPVRLMSGFVVQTPFGVDVIPRFEQSGGAVQIEWNPTSVLLREIDAGSRADVLLVTREAMDELVAKGMADASTRVELLSSNLGVAVKRGAPHPRIANVDEFREALLDARSVAYSNAGASGIYFGKLIAEWGIAETLNARATIIKDGLAAEKLLSGDADLAIQQISELLSVEGIEIVGPFPPGAQKALSFSAACFVGTDNLDEAKRFIAHIDDAAARDTYRRYGLDPV
ncbi:molybdate ABC transporter substrate-binding protein [Paraburkholderia sp. BCC1886]|uniref:molybdate ABC transporter substrate-binding protein n=1 Tax=Paraburkholderia sp. BCC1886 TaxID=2562670 RepID=UPI001C9103B1|nr:substrate-binding domain-containing protein [Paraburkholderia sp. BCC1886]